MSKMNVFITGGAGFIGSNLAEQLISIGHSVICYDNFDDFYSKSTKLENIQKAKASAAYQFIEGDILDENKLAEIFSDNKIDVVVHLAAKAGVRPSIFHPKTYYKTNVEGTLTILEAMQEAGIKKLVFASSSSIYGNNEKTPYSESDAVDHPISPYAATKKSCELLTHNFHHLYNFKIVNLRFFTVFGPRQRPDLAIHKFFKSLYTNQPIEVYGDGTTSRDYTYIDDIVAGIIATIDYLNTNESVYETINLGNNSPVKLSKLIETIEEVTQKKFVIKKMPMQIGDMLITYADIDKAKKLLGYQPRTSLREGLTNFKDWYESVS